MRSSMIHGFQAGYEDAAVEFGGELNFAVEELKKRRDDPLYLRMLLSYGSLSSEGQKKVVEYAEDLATGKYGRTTPLKSITLYGRDGFVTEYEAARNLTFQRAEMPTNNKTGADDHA